MKLYRTLFAVFMLALLLAPLIALPSKGGDAAEESGDPTAATKSESAEPTRGKAEETVRVLLHDTKQVVTVPVEEYLIGVLACEMSPTFHEEALKAQAVVSHTFLLRKQKEQTTSPDPDLNGADLSDDAARHQGYLTAEGRKQKWGDKAESYEARLKKAVRAVIDEQITYDGEPIIAAFHAVNGGQTLSAKQVWGGEIAYLQSVKSPGDKLSPDCTKTLALTEQEFAARAAALEGCKLEGDAKGWVGKIDADKSGFVKSITVGGISCGGQTFKTAMGLRSNVFTFEYRNATFFFTTVGYGHGVGMSQYGADYMARQGKKWDEIIRHYYTGAEIEKI